MKHFADGKSDACLIAQNLLEKLLLAGNKSVAGVRSRAPTLTKANLEPYRRLSGWYQKQECEERFLAARDVGAISFARDKGNLIDGQIERIELLDVGRLASFLDHNTYASVFEAAVALIEPLLTDFPVMQEVVDKWRAMGKVRSLGPQDASKWIEAAKVIKSCADSSVDAISIPVREYSARLFKDSKRIERLVPQMDVLLSGNIEPKQRPEAQVLQELGLFREEQPVLLAGKVTVQRNRVCAILDSPYSGFSAASVQSVQSTLTLVMTIENLTTFHSEAKRRQDENVLLIYTAGMPSPAWCAMYSRLLGSLPVDTPVFHWGDIDEGGFRIAARIATQAKSVGYVLQPQSMSPKYIHPEMLRKASAKTLERMRHFASQAGWDALGIEVKQAGFTVEQEALF